MRGKVLKNEHGENKQRITPAYAGKSAKLQSHTGKQQDHPRVCGEKEMELPYHDQAWGSPPRMRGKDFTKKKKKNNGRITPAYAGKSSQVNSFCELIWDHPRVCGEKADLKAAGLNPVGSPPRMRGKVRHARIDCAGLGITPAYAGKSLVISPSDCRIGDHPRVCGEKKRKRRKLANDAGSPPRMRGKD